MDAPNKVIVMGNYRVDVLLKIFKSYEGDMSDILRRARPGNYEITKLTDLEFERLLINVDRLLREAGHVGIMQLFLNDANPKLHTESGGR